MTTPLVLAASSGYVFELAAIASALGRQIVGVVGDGESATRAAQLEVPHLGPENDFRSVPNGAEVVVGEGPNALRQAAAESLAELGLAATTLIHPEATVGPFVTIGSGTVVSPGALITANVAIGRHVLIHTGAVVSHDDLLGDFVTLSPSSTLCGGVTVAAGATVFAGATVMPGVSIGESAVIGAGALVNRDVAPGSTVAGVPARPTTTTPPTTTPHFGS